MGVQSAVGMFSFEVQAPSAQRVQLWGAFARQASTTLEMNMVASAFNAFWWELAMVESFQHGGDSWQKGEVESVVCWLDLLLDEAATARSYWDEIGVSLELLETRSGALPRWSADASEASERLGQVMGQMTQEALALCQQWGLVVPAQVLAMATSLSQR